MSDDWYEVTREYTRRLVRCRSVGPSPDENRAAELALQLLREGGLDDAYTLSGLDAVADDPYGRHNAYAFLRGRSPRTVVLLGHLDTVGVADYGPLEPWALDPDELAARRDELARLDPEVLEDLAAHPDDWMFGRGVADMKSGVAATIAVMRRLAEQAREGRLALSIVLLATVDEENESAGILQAVRFLHQLRDRQGLMYAGAINTDYTAARYPGDPRRYIYTGTVGKLLPSLFVVGQAAHAGDPFAGLDVNLLAAELVRDLSMNTELCDRARGAIAPPPVTLHAADLKTGYDTQLPFAASFYLNVVTLTTEPAHLLDTLRRHAEAVLSGLLARLDEARERWSQEAQEGLRQGDEDSQSMTGSAGVSPVPVLPENEDVSPAHDAPAPTVDTSDVNGQGRTPTLPSDARLAQPQPDRRETVLTYAALRSETAARLGEARVAGALAAAWERCPAGLDGRERCLRLVQRLWALSGRHGPAVVLYYAPPYYPHIAAAPSLLRDAVDAVAAAHPELNLVVGDYFPLLSDLSYLRLDPSVDLAALRDNMPVWREPDAETPARAGSYSLPLAAMRALDLPAVNVGPYGRAVHQAGERVLMSYSFGMLPRLIYETIERLEHLTGYQEPSC